MSTPLHSIIVEKIRAEGPLDTATYMELCLTHPQYGYYTSRQPLGAEGDFITAPEITPLFGETLAIWTAKTWEDLGRPSAFTLVEGGPGKGTLMADLLRALKRMSPAAYKAATVCLLEISPTLRGEQAIALQTHTVDWAESLAEIPWQTPTLFIANELLDAFPISQNDTEGSPVLITETDGQLHFATPPTQVKESAPTQEHFLTDLKKYLTQGKALLIDYGYTEGTGDTLQALHKHQKVDIFHAPGETDLTAHVNFANAAHILGEQHCLIEDQATFLLRHGLALRATQALETAPTPEAHQHIEEACHRLISPQEMGTLFKVLQYTTA